MESDNSHQALYVTSWLRGQFLAQLLYRFRLRRASLVMTDEKRLWSSASWCVAPHLKRFRNSEKKSPVPPRLLLSMKILKARYDLYI